jgi:monosaccharide-transporting ATPase
MFISSELEEVLRTSHQIVVLRDHKKVAEYPGDVDDQTIMQTMAGNV